MATVHRERHPRNPSAHTVNVGEVSQRLQKEHKRKTTKADDKNNERESHKSLTMRGEHRQCGPTGGPSHKVENELRTTSGSSGERPPRGTAARPERVVRRPRPTHKAPKHRTEADR